MNLVQAQEHPPVERRMAVRGDAELVAVVLAGRRESFAELVHRYQRAVKVTVLRTVRDVQLAEDVAQEAFVKAFEQLPRLRDPQAFGGWLLTIARQHAVHCSKRQARVRKLTHGCHAGRLAVPDDNPLECEALMRAIDALPGHERVVVMLRYFEDHDVATIARITGRPVGTVTKQLSRAHRRLRAALEDQS